MPAEMATSEYSGTWITIIGSTCSRRAVGAFRGPLPRTFEVGAALLWGRGRGYPGALVAETPGWHIGCRPQPGSAEDPPCSFSQQQRPGESEEGTERAASGA